MPRVFVVYREIETLHGKQRQVVSPRFRLRQLADRHMADKGGDGIVELDLEQARDIHGFLHGDPDTTPVAERRLHYAPVVDFASSSRLRVKTGWHNLLRLVDNKPEWDYLDDDGTTSRTVVRWGAHQLAMAWHAANGTEPFHVGYVERERHAVVEHILKWTSQGYGDVGPYTWQAGLEGRTRVYEWATKPLTIIRCDTLALEGGKLVPAAPDHNGANRGRFGDMPWLQS